MKNLKPFYLSGGKNKLSLGCSGKRNFNSIVIKLLILFVLYYFLIIKDLI